MTDYSDFIFKNFYKLDGYRIFFPRRNPTFNNPEFEKSDFASIDRSSVSNFKISVNLLHTTFFSRKFEKMSPRLILIMHFFPEQKNIRLFKDNNIPFFLGIQSLHPINDFDLVLVSNSFTLELFNLSYLFSNAGIPGLKSNRQALLPL